MNPFSFKTKSYKVVYYQWTAVLEDEVVAQVGDDGDLHVLAADDVAELDQSQGDHQQSCAGINMHALQYIMPEIGCLLIGSRIPC